MTKNQCAVCDNDTFENISGFYYCIVCNTQSQNVCDYELSDDETVHVGKQINKTSASKLKKKFEPEDQKSIDSNYSSFHILNYLLKSQVDDLIKIGVNPVIKKIVLELWMKYLQKVGIAFLPINNTEINSKNIRVERDKKFFEIYQLKQEHENENKKLNDEGPIDANDLVWPEFFKNENIDNNDSELANEQIDINMDDNEKENSYQSSEDEDEFGQSESIDDIDIDESAKAKSRITPLTKFEFIRMPHTLCLINLALLIMKSKLLVTDLIRLIFNGKISYFNINKVLPEYIVFTYTADLLMFNATLAIPNANILRLVTSKLGQFLDLKTIDTLSLNAITSRFIVDLNLPSQMHGLTNLLLQKTEPYKKNELNLAECECRNIEELALAHIYIVIVVIIEYDPIKLNDDSNGMFVFSKWMKAMQNILINYKKNLYGCDTNKVINRSDLETMKYESIDHRHNLRAKPYISQYRRELIKTALKAPLLYCQTKLDDSKHSLDITESHLFSICTKTIENFSKTSLNFHVNKEKLSILGKPGFKSKLFKKYSKNNLEFVGTKSIYLIGVEANTTEWLLDVFREIAHSESYFKMFKCVDRLLNMII